MGVWAVLLVARIVVVGVVPDIDLGVILWLEAAAVVAGLVVVVVGLRRAWLVRARAADDLLEMAVKRVDPTARVVHGTPTEELRRLIGDSHPDAPLGQRVTWGFGATEASLWVLDERRAVRVLVIRWTKVVHVTLEDADDEPSLRGPVVALHFVRRDDSAAVATFAVRVGAGRSRVLRRGARLDRLVQDLAAERILV
jgi:hypothetical protein